MVWNPRMLLLFFFFNDTATTEIYPLSLHDALPISVGGVNAYRSRLIPTVNTNALSVQAASLDLPATTGTTVAHGRFLNPATAAQPAAMLGATAAARLGIDRLYPGERIWVGPTASIGQWFYLTGI